MKSTTGERIKNARKKVGLTQKQLAAKYGIPARSIEDWETLKHKCPNYVANLLIDRIALDYVADLTEAIREEILFARVALDDDTVTAKELADERLTAQRLSEQGSTTIPSEPVPEQKKLKYTLHYNFGKRLSEEDAAFVEGEITGGRINFVSEYEDGSGWKQYVCKKVVDEIETDFDFVIRPSKEV